MPLMTGEQYVESLREMNMKIYFQGKKIENPIDYPIIRPSLNCLIKSYNLALMSENEDLLKNLNKLLFIKRGEGYGRYCNC